MTTNSPSDTPATNLSVPAAAFLLNLVNRLTLSVDDPQFEATVAQVIHVKKELEGIVAALPPAGESNPHQKN